MYTIIITYVYTPVPEKELSMKFDFLVILKRMPQNYKEILKKYLFVVGSIVYLLVV